MTYHKEGPACGKIPCDPTSSEADCEYLLDPYQLQSSHSVGINSPGVQKMCRIYGAAMRNNMNEKLEKIKNWFKRYPYMIALLYMAFYLKAFEWLEQNIVPRYIIHSVCILVSVCGRYLYLVQTPRMGRLQEALPDDIFRAYDLPGDLLCIPDRAESASGAEPA